MSRKPETANSEVRGGSAPLAEPFEEITSVPLQAHHDVAAFKSRSKNVRKFIVECAMSWQSSRACRVFVFENPEKKEEIWGFYSLSSSSLIGPQIPEEDRVGFPSHVRVPMPHLGHMGRHHIPLLKGIGPGILYDAALRVARSREDVDAVGIWLTPDAAGGAALKRWYMDCGFQPIMPNPHRPDAQPIMYAKLEPLLDELRRQLDAPIPDFN